MAIRDVLTQSWALVACSYGAKAGGFHHGLDQLPGIGAIDHAIKSWGMTINLDPDFYCENIKACVDLQQ